MPYTVYKTTNNTTGRYYIGVHKTQNPYDNYMGSGKLLKRAIEKYGLDNFTKEVLFIFDTPENAYAKEKELVTIDLLESGECYNLKVGGEGGWGHLKQKTPEHRKKICSSGAKTRFLDEDYKKWWYSHRASISVLGVEARNRLYPEGTFKNRKHTEDTKRKIGEVNSKKQLGELNSQYGTCWIHHAEQQITKKIKKDELDTYLEQGWIQGRKMKTRERSPTGRGIRFKP